MKSIFTIIVLAVFSFSNAQNLSDYEQIFVPTNLSGKNIDNYGLQKILTSKLKNKGYKVSNGQFSERDCSSAYADILNTSSLFKNKITVEIKDCNNKILYREEGISDNKEFETGYPDALNKALSKIQNSKPIIIAKDEKIKTATIPVKEEPIKEEKQIAKSASDKVLKVEIFSDGTQDFTKINIAEGQFILARGNSSVPYANFKESTKRGVFRVQLENGAQTLGYFEGNTIVVEIPQGNNSYSRQVLTAK